MKTIRWGKWRPRLLAAYLEGEVGTSEAAAAERLLAESSDAREELEQLRGIRAALSNSGREFADVDLLPSIKARIRDGAVVRVGRSEGFLERLWRRPAAAVFAAGLATAAVCLGLAFVPRGHATDEEFRAKSASLAPNPARWAGVQAYRVAAQVWFHGYLRAPDGPAPQPTALGEALGPDDGLLFSYTNLGSAPLANLMIFAVDSSGEVHWFHPAYEREGTDPSSISIQKGAAQVPLAELIQDKFPAGPLTIHALFSHRALHVLEVEGWLKRDPRANLVELVPGSVDQILTTRVEP